MKRYGKEIDLESEDINYTVSFSENNRGDFLTYNQLSRHEESSRLGETR
jgi:hypothetical protein